MVMPSNILKRLGFTKNINEYTKATKNKFDIYKNKIFSLLIIRSRDAESQVYSSAFNENVTATAILKIL